MLLDLHSHRNPPYPEGIISTAPEALPASPGEQRYSTGIHPWHLPITGISQDHISILEAAASRSDVVAIGECGIDLAKEGLAPLAMQMIAFRKQVEISEKVGKPLIIHCVKAHDIIIGIKKELQPKQRWIIHGFRGKPSILRMLLDADIAVSYGERFNSESVAATPLTHLYAETDESPLPILDIITLLSSANPAITPSLISSNLQNLSIPIF